MRLADVQRTYNNTVMRSPVNAHGAILTAKQDDEVVEFYHKDKMSVVDICAKYDVCGSVIYRILNEYKERNL